ncbi:hypothetical protein GIB67_034771 [Kingdonia uniflora]|uniref:Uncharacterized protein n=1 Tax=Kingdonia uniflora TaxID=39325 RepID=A0A7J7MDP7_9MAGN|nr:hypothetical protein GIB67_034771 [Kingdonia uniflora]
MLWVSRILILRRCFLGSETVVEVVTAAFCTVCEEVLPRNLSLMWDCLLSGISHCIDSKRLLHLNYLLSILISTIQFCKRGKFSDSQRANILVRLLIERFIIPSTSLNAEDHIYEIINKVLLLMVCLVDVLLESNDISDIAKVSLQWAPVFEAPVFTQRSESLLNFIRELLLRDPCIPYAFRNHIISAVNDLREVASLEEVIYLMMTFFEKLQLQIHSGYSLDSFSQERISKMSDFLQEFICEWTRTIHSVECGVSLTTHLDESKLAEIWGILRCYPHVLGVQVNPSSILPIKDLLAVLDELAAVKAGKICIHFSDSGVPKRTWESLIGTTLTSVAACYKLSSDEHTGVEEIKMFLDLAKKYKSSSQVLFAVAGYLDSIFGQRGELDVTKKSFHPELEVEKTFVAIHEYADNLSSPDSEICISTLRILCHYEPLDQQLVTNNRPAKKKSEAAAFQQCNKDIDRIDVIQLLLLIETTPLSVSTSRKAVNLISRMQTDLSSGKISEDYIPLVSNGMIGIFHKRFGDLWEPALDCLTVLLTKYIGLVWDKFFLYLEHYQSEFLTSCNQLEIVEVKFSSKPSGLVDCFHSFLTPKYDSTPRSKVLSLLLQSLQRVQTISQSRSRHLIPLFLRFLGYKDDFLSVGSYNSQACKGREWRAVFKEWLNLLTLMRNPRFLYRSEVVKEILLERFLADRDADIQMKVLDCLWNWKDDCLVPYYQHLKNLITPKELKEELVTWALSKESNSILEIHREYLIPIIIRLLMPKVRALGSRKHAGMPSRRSVLCFLAQLDVNELPLFFFLLVKPLITISDGCEGLPKLFWSSSKSSIEKIQVSDVVKNLTMNSMASISWKKREGLLHITEEVLESFDKLHLRPFLNLLMGFVVRIMGSCTLNIDISKSSKFFHDKDLYDEDSSVMVANSTTFTSVKQVKDMRSKCLKIISSVFIKYGDHHFDCEFWNVFFTSVKSLIESFKQEGSSSEKPSSLFLCFLAMSRSHTLVSLFHKEQTIVPTIFSILTVKTASRSITSSVFCFIENLLSLDSDLDSDQDPTIKGILEPNLEELLNSLHSYFECHSENLRKSAKCPGGAELKILKQLQKYVRGPVAARKFLDIVLPSVRVKTTLSDECVDGLHIIEGILPELGSECSKLILTTVAPLLISASLEVRLSICDLLASLGVKDSADALLVIAGLVVELSLGVFLYLCINLVHTNNLMQGKLVKELNAISVTEMGELDYDTRVNAYDSIRPEFFFTVRDDHALVVLSHSIYDMSSEELILRQSACRLFLSFIKFSAFVLGSNETKGPEAPKESTLLDTDSCWTKTRVRHIIKKFILKHMEEGMNKEITIQREWIALLREMVLGLPQVSELNSIKDLCDKDAEVDFFNNILHIQLHRRPRALSRFRNAIGSGKFSHVNFCSHWKILIIWSLLQIVSDKYIPVADMQIITERVFIPLFFKMFFDVEAGKENLRNACLESLAAISGHMQWDSYQAFLKRCFKEMTLNLGKQKAFLRLICSVLDHFHFQEATSSNQQPKITSLLELASSSTEVQDFLQKTLLPRIQKILKDADLESVNADIHIAELKVLKLLPASTMESRLPSIIQHISNFLKNRHMLSIRDEARSALVKCLKELGLEYLKIIVEALRTTLKRGYELHVLGYTLNCILSKSLVSPSVTTGKLDYCLEELLAIAVNDIMGEVAEEKDIEKIASKLKETRKQKSFETLTLIAQNVTFDTHSFKLLSPVKANLQKHLTSKLKIKLMKMLDHIATGIESNPSASQSEVLIFTYHLIKNGIQEDTLQGRDISVPEPDNFSRGGAAKRNLPRKVIDPQSRSSHLIVIFGLRILYNCLKKVSLGKKDGKLVSMLDPFVELLGDCLKSKYEEILSEALKCLTTLIRLPLPSLNSLGDNIKNFLLDIAQNSGNSGSILVQSCLKLLTVLLKSTNITLSTVQLHLLIQFPVFIDLERNPSFLALDLLEAIVRRNFVVAEIYDIANQVLTLMVTSQMEPIRKKCSQILLKFLIGYGLQERRLKQHLDILLEMLSYEHSTGREAVLEMLHNILEKLPKNFVDGQANNIFVNLVQRLQNDSDSNVSTMKAGVIKKLIGCINQNNVRGITQFGLTWYMEERQRYWIPGAEVLGILVEVLKNGLKEHIGDVFAKVKSILESCLSEQTDCPNEALCPFWKEAYYSLILFEKMINQFPELYSGKGQEIWELICDLLLHRHIKLRSISNHLLFSYFAAASSDSSIRKTKLETFLLMKPSRLFKIAASFCCQLEGQLSDDSSSNEIIIQNIVFAISRLYSLVGKKKCQDFWCTLELKEQHHFVKAFQLLEPKNGIIYCVNFEDSTEKLQSVLVSPLLKKLAKLALIKEDVQMKIIFKCFQKISVQLGQEGCQQNAIHLLRPFYKVCEGYAGKVIEDDVKQLAEEVRDTIKEILGQGFAKLYLEIKMDVDNKRKKKKEDEKIMAVVDPEANAKRKRRNATKNQKNKKRKVTEMKKRKR